MSIVGSMAKLDIWLLINKLKWGKNRDKKHIPDVLYLSPTTIEKLG